MSDRDPRTATFFARPQNWKVGDRAVVRYYIGAEQGNFTDALGYITEIDDNAITIATRKRGSEKIEWIRVLTAKLVPPPPIRKKT